MAATVSIGLYAPFAPHGNATPPEAGPQLPFASASAPAVGARLVAELPPPASKAPHDGDSCGSKVFQLTSGGGVSGPLINVRTTQIAVDLGKHLVAEKLQQPVDPARCLFRARLRGRLRLSVERKHVSYWDLRGITRPFDLLARRRVDHVMLSPDARDRWRYRNGIGTIRLSIVAFSQTDFTDDLKKITVPVHVMHGDDDQIVPYADAGPLSAKLVKNGTLKTYKGFPHGMPTTQADTINADLLVFLKA
jgi:pimeloyl-ACP methyl ester carboxylesterase